MRSWVIVVLCTSNIFFDFPIWHKHSPANCSQRELYIMNLYFKSLSFITQEFRMYQKYVNIDCILLLSHFCWVYDGDGAPADDFSFGFTGSCKLM